MIQYLPVVIIVVLFGTVAGLGYVDRRKKRDLDALPSVSFIVPCYNDGDTVGQTLASIYEVCGPGTDVIVADDGSRDGGCETLERLRERYRFTLVHNRRNVGKSKTLNDHFHLAKHDIIVFADADMVVNRRSLHDAVARLQAGRKVGAVSCPYAPQNSSIIPLMQHIEYNMLSFIQGAYNCFSAIALWGGFIVIKRQAFLDAGGFTLNAITEDMDLAFKLNEVGWRVEQSFFPVRTHVPGTLKQWYKQKIRWSSGGFQCFIKHYRIWVKNPLHVMFVCSFCVLLSFAALNMGKDIVMWDRILAYFHSLNDRTTLGMSLRLTTLHYGIPIVTDLMWRMSFTLLSLPFVWPLVSSVKRIHLALLVVPFSIVYVPLFSAISLCGAVHFLFRRRELLTASRAW